MEPNAVDQNGERNLVGDTARHGRARRDKGRDMANPVRDVRDGMRSSETTNPI
jgi:hypothetical protein